MILYRSCCRLLQPSAHAFKCIYHLALRMPQNSERRVLDTPPKPFHPVAMTIATCICIVTMTDTKMRIVANIDEFIKAGKPV